MPFHRTLGIAIRIADFSETSQVVTFLTQDFGKLSLIAKGAKRPKNNFDGPIQIFRHASLVFIPKKHGALGILTESRTLETFMALSLTIERYYAACYSCELSDAFIPESQEASDIYSLLLQFFKSLCSGCDVATSLCLFELHFLRILGHMPWRTVCPDCERPLKKHDTVAFSIRLGGGLCQNCHAKDPLAITTSASTIILGHRLSNLRYLHPERLRVSRISTERLRELTTHLICSLLGRQPRTLPHTLPEHTSNTPIRHGTSSCELELKR